jgi:hypothetical protein
MPEPIFFKLDMHIMVLEPTSTAHFLNPSHQSHLLVFSLIADRQRFGKNVTAATNSHLAIEELLDA